MWRFPRIDRQDLACDAAICRYSGSVRRHGIRSRSMILPALVVAAAGFHCTISDANPSAAPVILELRRDAGGLVDQSGSRYVLVGENQNGLAAAQWISGKDLLADTPYVGSRTIVINKVTGAFSLSQLSIPLGGGVETVAGLCTHPDHVIESRPNPAPAPKKKGGRR
ncbi:hypothetical protein [Sphingomonas nostoxanthinifaciens]|uniref:hypothetical protein n=1 Tax=Sphingomonas nostoxanthinifaciens TaxID=2872652 RepID=UPI001CC1EE89|nr:hypothetical protein [Sphingomonas nostoxanthinifaciens]UAK24162.1 hypothetical protein K8P63_17825 [Sphingomonas nostoxanthinifaciens]